MKQWSQVSAPSGAVALVLMSGGGSEVDSTGKNINPAPHVPSRVGQHFDPAGHKTWGSAPKRDAGMATRNPVQPVPFAQSCSMRLDLNVRTDNRSHLHHVDGFTELHLG
jgi:hypothetical protein